MCIDYGTLITCRPIRVDRRAPFEERVKRAREIAEALEDPELLERSEATAKRLTHMSFGELFEEFTI